MSLAVVETLARLLGAENVRADEESSRRAFSTWVPVPQARMVSAVALPGDSDEVAGLVRWANESRTPLYPVGGASNIVGAGFPSGDGGVAVDLSRLQTLTWDEESLLVTCGAGLTLGAVEEKLNAHEYTHGQFPQSLNLLTVGGAIATDAIGLLSGRYGRMGDATKALTVVLPDGSIVRTAAPPLGSAAFDLHHLFIGAEGAFGIITEATLAMRPMSDVRAWAVFSFPRWEDGADALRLVYRSDARPACARLLDTTDVPGVAPGHVVLVMGFEGDELAQAGQYQLAYGVCQRVAADTGGEALASDLGDTWFEARRGGGGSAGFLAANARPEGVAERLALSTSWSALKDVYAAVRAALEPRCIGLSVEICHSGPHGAALEIVVEAQASSAEAAPALREQLREAAFTVALENNAATAHHYGIGRTRQKAWADERGETGVALLWSLKATLDPNNILNPGGLP